MDHLEVEYASLNAKIKELAAIYSGITAEVADLAGYVENLDIFWDGEANAAYINRISADLTEIGVMMLSVRNVVKTARLALDLYISNEKAVKIKTEEDFYGTKNQV